MIWRKKFTLQQAANHDVLVFKVNSDAYHDCGFESWTKHHLGCAFDIKDLLK